MSAAERKILQPSSLIATIGRHAATNGSANHHICRILTLGFRELRLR